MSGNEGDSSSPPVSREEENRADSSKSRSLKDATHKLKAEALRRFQLGDAEYDGESGKHKTGSEGSSVDDAVNRAAGIESDSRTDFEKAAKDFSKAAGDDFNDDKHEAVDSDINKSQKTAPHSKDYSKSDFISEDNTQLKPRSGQWGGQESVRSVKESVEPSTVQGSRNVADGKLSSEQGDSKERDSTSESQIPSGLNGETDEGRLVHPGSKHGSANSRPGSGRSTPRSDPKRLASGEKEQKTTSSRPGSGTKSRSGSGVGKQKDLGNKGGRDGANKTAGDPVSEESHVQGGLSGRDADSKVQVNVKNNGSNVNIDKDSALPLNDRNTGTLHVQSNDLPEQQPKLHVDTENMAASGTLRGSLIKVESGLSGAEFSELSGESKSKQDLEGDDEISDNVSPPMNKSNANKSQISDFAHSDDKQDPGKGEDSEVTAEEDAAKENKDGTETLLKEGLSAASHDVPLRNEEQAEVEEKDSAKSGPEEDPTEFDKKTGEGKEESDQANKENADTEKPADQEASEGDLKGTGVSGEAEGEVGNIGEGVSEVDQSGTERNAGEKRETKKRVTQEKSTDQGGGIEDEEEGKGEEHVKSEQQDDTDKSEQPVVLVEGQEEDSERILPEEFCYDFEELVSRPFSTEGIPADLLSFHHSFGYECTKRSNLHVLDENSVLFSAGNMVEILNLKTQSQTYMRTTGGGGIGAIAVHPSRKYFAVAENGTKPNINIYEYPSLKLHRILRDGTEEAYSHLDFSPKGDKLASVGSAPDYMLTVWDWKNEQVILRSKAFSQDIYKVAFSPEDEGHLCTSGSGHIRFWTMAHTFTGLKLQGLIGKFGAKELSDIEGFVELPDGKVLSGSEWGNMLLWDGGLIKVEISKKGRKPCHLGMIEQFFMDEGELMTIGADGFVKVWDFESIDNADATEEGQVFEIDPMYELKVGTDVKLMSMMKAVNSEAPIWFAQDASGGIWKLDLSFTHTSHAPEKMYSYHAGPITGLDTSPVAPFVATTGVDHSVRVYDYLSKTPMCHAKYNSGGTSLLWVPKVVDNKGNKVLAGFADGVVRVLALNKVDPSQVRNKKSKLNFELNLEQVFKPHTKAVHALSIDDKGELLATGGDDCTVFFFSVGERFKPIGFIETASPVVSLDWSKKRKVPKSVLISCKDGTVLHVEAPVLGKYDTSKTFHLPLDNLKTTEYHFKTVKEKLRKAEEEAQKAKEEEEKRKKKEEERARRRARGLQDEEEEEKEEGKKEEGDEEEEQKEEEETKVELHQEPGETIKGFYYGKTDKFWLTMDGWDAGYLYQCKFDDGTKPIPAEEQEDTRGEPVKAIPVDNSDDKPIRSVCFSHSGKFMLLGMDNGVVRIHPLDQNMMELEHLNSFWSLTVHDNQHGSIRHIKTSFDDKYVLTAGMDGNFFVFRFMDEAVKGLKIPSKLSLPSAKKLIGEEGEEIEKKVDDIDDPNHYSIELEKQKAEHDRMVKLAEEKKQNIRRKIGNLRRAFKELMTKNQKLPAHVQMTQNEFEIDPDLIKDQKVEVENKIELVRKEMAWEAEKHAIGLRKLQKRFKDDIECERIVLRAFLTSHLVTAFRASKPDYLQQLLEESMWAGGEGSDAGGHGRKSFSSGAKAAQMKRRGTQEKMPLSQQQQQQQAPQSQGQLGGKVAKALEKAEARRQKRLARQAQWNELYRNKPDEGYQDPKDVTAIKEARENMGDYKLKTAKDYVVPESLRVNAEKKRIQLLHLLDQIHHFKFEFNQRFLAHRNKKISIIKEMKETVIKLEEVQRKMDPYSKRSIPKIPEMMPDECPEKRLEYTRDQLLEFKKEMDEKTHQLHGDQQGGGFGGFGGGSSSEHPKLGHHGSKPITQQRDRSISSVSVHSSGRPKSSLSTLTDKGTPEPAIEEVIEEPSPLELEMQYEEKIRLQYEQDVLIDKINSTLEKFDADLRTLRHDKMHLEIALKCADLRHVTLFEEFMLLKEFEKRENIFANKVNSKLNEKEEMQEKVEDCQMQLDSKKQDIEKLQEQEKSLYATFASALGENNKFESFLTRVFKKKIKRAKKKTQAAEGSDEESEDEDSDEDLSSSDEEDSDSEELDDSVCPPGCDQSIFDQVCQLRERRLDLEEELTEEKKTNDTLKKEYDALVKKSKVIDSALKTAEADLEAFQREKQQKLNELDVVVVLRLSQIQYMLNGCLPQDLSQCLVFSSPDLIRLQHRIKELEKEKAEQKRLYREHRQTHVQLIRDKKVQEARIDELEEKVRNMLMLKFGRLVDLEKLETVSVNRTVEELKEKLRQQESKSAAEIAKWNGKIDSYKSKVTQLTRENTQRLDTFTVLLQEKKELEQMLNSRQKSLGTEFTGSRKADIRERQRLVQLVQLQAQEIDALKDEITLLSRKGGHILPPAQPPLPPGQTPIPNQ